MVESNTPRRQGGGWLLKFGVVVVLAFAGYFGNKAVQSYFGQQALDGTGLVALSLDEALVKAEKENKLVLADMSAIWCPTCRRLDKEVFSSDVVKDVIDDQYIFARIEYESEQGKAFMERYKVRGFPTLLVLSSNGDKMGQLPLTFMPEEFAKMIDRS
ncbi:thioredoxin family protein [Alteromonadaceae bacterium M269]|nr:thioredoxin family protein [Alteromonadaceae bacterium M269]